MRSVHVGSVLVFASFGALAWNAGCGSNPTNPDGGAGDDGGGGLGGGMFAQVDAASHCVNGTICPATNCNSGSETSITGTVLDPAGNNPIPYVAVYVPQHLTNGGLDPLPLGAHCADCQSLFTNTVLASDITKSDGTFNIHGLNVPVGQSIPLVVQAGKWRRLFNVTVNGCTGNAVGNLKLPGKSADGDLPHIAISTGGADSLECLLSRVGVDDKEYVDGSSMNGHIHIFQGGTTGAGNPGPTIDNNTPISSKALWDTTTDLQKYDIVLLSCEGAETGTTQPAALDTYVKVNGGRVFASHFHYSWFTDTNGPFVSYNLAQWTAGTNDTGNINAVIETQLPAGGMFPKGQALHDWLQLVGALGAGGVKDELPIQASRYNALVTKNNPNATPWIAGDGNVQSPGVPGMTQYFSWDEPIGAGTEKLCGRVVYSDLHVGAASDDYGNLPGATNMTGPAVTTGGVVPTGCHHNAKLSPQEAALEFMLFDLSSCLTPTNTQPPPPMVAQ
ncbi:MAG TPA: hypothetical protein VE987_20250 [Polyangiaceae bacterium]|nr:hypothetical protein [Polyangiaceae bacterium]